nr:MAG TPA: hypothetical protein [Caudoviricetes sp.]
MPCTSNLLKSYSTHFFSRVFLPRYVFDSLWTFCHYDSFASDCLHHYVFRVPRNSHGFHYTYFYNFP